MENKIKNIIQKIPRSAGIYQFFDGKGKIIYIGKSVNLKSRVSSYFNGKTKLNFAKQKMINQIKDIKTILVENETESLILETNLIKENLPKYNILMKDGKNHNYIKITTDQFPKIIKTRVKYGKGEFYGPYISSFDVDNILKVAKNVFGYGVGKHNFFKNKNSYNLDKYLFESPDTTELSELQEQEVYNEILERIRAFLKGNQYEIIQKLKEKMFNYANDHNFEKADIIKKQIDSIETLNQRQIVREGVIGDFDIINYIQKFDNTYIGKIEIRDSKIVGFYPFEINSNLEEDIENILTTFTKNNYLNQILINQESKKPRLISPKKIELEEDIFKNIKIEVPKIGTKQDLLKMCYKNIYEYAYKKHLESLSTKGFSKKTMENILELLNYKKNNKQILFECNDISHISGNFTVASRSIIENGKSNSGKYRKFKIKNLKEGEINDFDSMKEIAIRRLKEIEKTGIIPDLIVIDGGKGQLSSVFKVFEESILAGKNIQLVGLAKKEEELFLPGISEPIILKKDSNELRLIQKIRDEAHRFAITFNRDSRNKSMKKNILESLPGFGIVTRKKVLKKYGNISKLKEVSIEELSKILNKNQIETLENHGII